MRHPLPPLLVVFQFLACGPGAQVSKGHPPTRQPPANTVGGFQIDVPPITLMPGEEQFPCFLFPLAIDGPSRVVGGAQMVSGAGLHHANVTTRKESGTGIRQCESSNPGDEIIDVLAGGTVLFGSSTQHIGSEWLSFPKGMGYQVQEGYEIAAHLHYLNASSQPVTVTPHFEWYTIDEKQVSQIVVPFAWDHDKFTIPPKSVYTVSADCEFPGPMKIVSALPHMHKLGTALTASFLGGPLAGKPFIDSKGYDPQDGVLLQFDPPLDLSQADGVTFSCTWDNTFDEPITFGYGKNEMCILFGYGYPAVSTYSTLAGDNGSCLVLPVSR
jgi:hypothetical protein